MVSSVAIVVPAQGVSQVESAQQSPKDAKITRGQVETPAYTVQLSNAALAVLQEATETPAQTTKEAAGGDRQAQRLLAKEAAAKQALEK